MTGPLSIWELLIRAGLAVVLGAIIGWDRERHDKAAGLRTMALVSLGSAAAMLVAVEANTYRGADDLDFDPLRVVQGVVGGIGFLGAGSIIQSRGTVRGMTTAATIWASAGLGIACGMGLYRIAGVVFGLTLATLVLLGAMKGTVLPEHEQRPEQDA